MEVVPAFDRTMWAGSTKVSRGRQNERGGAVFAYRGNLLPHATGDFKIMAVISNHTDNKRPIRRKSDTDGRKMQLMWSVNGNPYSDICFSSSIGHGQLHDEIQHAQDDHQS